MASGITINFRIPAKMASEYKATIIRLQEMMPDLKPKDFHCACIALFLDLPNDEARITAIGDGLRYPLKDAIVNKVRKKPKKP